jgi:hypothetical protein
MALKTILTVTGTELSNSDLRLTAGLCEEIGAHLSVFVIGLAAPPPVGEYAAMVSDVWLEQRQEDLKELEGARRRAVLVGSDRCFLCLTVPGRR